MLNKHLQNALNELSYLVPFASAQIKGGKRFPQIKGNLNFVRMGNGILVISSIENLPKTDTNIFGMHIHSGEVCEGDFLSAGEHLNNGFNNHPNHIGDLLPIISNNGKAWSAVLYNKFTIDDIINKSVIIHFKPDDFRTQPGGDSGERIACGIIRRY